MDYLLNVFFNSNTSDGPAKNQPQHPAAPDFQISGPQYFSPWKWDWRQSDGPGWFETGNLNNSVKYAEAALGKLTLRLWNRDPTMTKIVHAKVILNVTSSGIAQPINTVFAAYKYEDEYGRTHLNMFQDGDVEDTTIALADVPGGEESNAENGDQIMPSWDVVELHFSSQPQPNTFIVRLFVLFGSVQPDGSVRPDNKIFFIDPEMDIGLTGFPVE